MGSNLEGNWELLHAMAAEKPIAKLGSATFKRTFLFDSETGQLLIQKPESDEEKMLLDNRNQFSNIRLLRGLWHEQPAGDSSGTYFPVAAPAGGGVMWGSAGHCLVLSNQRNWRCGYRLQVLPTSPSSEPGVRDSVDLSWLTAGMAASAVAESKPSQPSESIPAAIVMPDFGFMLTKYPAVEPQQLFIPCARQLTTGDLVCVLGFAHRPDATWARTFLRTEEDYQQQVLEYRTRSNSAPPAHWELSDGVALERLSGLQEEVVFASRLVAAPGQVIAATERIIEHSCSTFPGMSGGPGVDMGTPWKLLFVHTRADMHWRRSNYGYSVHHPLFVKAYVREVLPRLLATPPTLLTMDMVECLHEYLEVHHEQLDPGVLDKVAQLKTR